MKRGSGWLLLESVDEGADAKRRARVVVIGSALAAVIAGAIAGLQANAGNVPIAWASLASVFAALANLAVVVRAGTWRACGVVLCVLIFVPACYAVYATGGQLPAGGFYLCLVPLLATLIGGGRSGAAAAIGCGAALIGIEALRRSGADFPLQIDAEEIARSNFRGTLFFQVVLLCIAFVYDQLRRASLDEVAESAARYEALADNAPDLVAELDAEGRLCFVSPLFERVFGRSRERMIGSRLRDWVEPEDGDAVRRLLDEALVRGSATGAPFRAKDGEGRTRWLEPALTAYDPADAQRRILLVARDLTDRLRIEERQRQSQKMEAIGQLAGGVAHDFNNLLTVIIGTADELRHRPEDATRGAEEILRAAEQAESLTRKLLAVSRPRTTERRATDLNACVAEISGLLSRLIGDAIHLDTELAPELPAVLADPSHIEQILVNLAVNARDAMRDGGTLTVKTAVVGGRVTLSVIDSGIGMTPEVRERVFEAFFTTKEERDGTGLGLAMIYSLVTDMRGDIEIESEAGRGTTIRITLPPLPLDVLAEPAQGRPIPSPRGGNETILLVEDREEVRIVVRDTLERAGYKVIAAENGEGALAIVRADTPVDLVLSDVVMPERSGPSLVREARTHRPELRFLLMSGNSTRQPAEPLPADVPLLRKPFRPDALRAEVRRALDRG